QSQHKTEALRGQGGGVAGGNERFPHLGQFDLEVEQVGLEQLSRLETLASGVRGRFQSAHAGLDRDDGFACLLQRQRRLHHLGRQLVPGSLKIVLRRLRGRAGGGTPGGGSTAVVEGVAQISSRRQRVDRTRI